MVMPLAVVMALFRLISTPRPTFCALETVRAGLKVKLILPGAPPERLQTLFALQLPMVELELLTQTALGELVTNTLSEV